MKVLLISPVPTDPAGAGNRARIATLASALQDHGHELHFAYLPLEAADLDAMKVRFGPGRLHVPPWRATKGPWVRRVLKMIGKSLSIDSAHAYRLDDWYDAKANDFLKALQAEHRYEVVVVEYVFMSKAFEAFKDVRMKILDTHDRFGLRHRSYLKAGQKPEWYSTSDEEELRGFRRANMVIGIQAQEADDFRQRLGPASTTRVIEVGHLTAKPQPFKPSQAPSAVFLGSSNAINVAACEYFIQEVAPIVLATFPDFKLFLAGSVSNQFTATKLLHPLGFVESLSKAFSHGAVAVNPVQMGTGVNIKLLDALAHGMPCVTTVSGARGLEALADVAMVMVEDQNPHAFAQQLIALLSQPARRAELQRSALQAANTWNERQLGSLTAALRSP